MRTTNDKPVVKSSGIRPVRCSYRKQLRLETEVAYYDDYDAPLYIYGRYSIDDEDDGFELDSDYDYDYDYDELCAA